MTLPDLDATLVLVRHGESEYIAEGRFQGQHDTPLSAIGRRQAQLTGERLAHPHRSPVLPVPVRPPLEIVHSPLSRAAATASAIADALGGAGSPVTSRPHPGLTEIGQGEWEGRLHTEIAERWPDVLAGWRRRPTEHWAPGGESLADVQRRVRPAIASVLEPLAAIGGPGDPGRPQVAGYRGAAAPDQPWTVVVAHDGVFKVLVLTLFDLPIERFWMFTLALCGIAVVELRGGRPVLRAHNLTEHLAPLLEERAEVVAEERARSGAL